MNMFIALDMTSPSLKRFHAFCRKNSARSQNSIEMCYVFFDAIIIGVPSLNWLLSALAQSLKVSNTCVAVMSSVQKIGIPETTPDDTSLTSQELVQTLQNQEDMLQARINEMENLILSGGSVS